MAAKSYTGTTLRCCRIIDMGLVQVTGMIGKSVNELTALAFLVDTGSFYTAIAPPDREPLKLPPGIPTQTAMADRRIVDCELTVAHLQLGDREGAIPVEIMDVPHPLLGVSALEALGLKVNPVDGTLEHRFPFPGTVNFTRSRG